MENTKKIQRQRNLGGSMETWELFPRREFDSSDPLNLHCRIAEAQVQRYFRTRDIVKVTFVINHTLQSDFKETEK